MKYGRYVGRVVDETLAYVQNGQQMEMLIEVMEGPEKGNRVSYESSFNGKGAAFTLEAMRACGWDTGKPLSDVRKNTIEFDYYQHEYNGKTFDRVRILVARKALKTAPENRMAADAATEFLSNLCGSAPTPSDAGAAKPMRQPGEDDDLRF